jgi:hypothetical protein
MLLNFDIDTDVSGFTGEIFDHFMGYTEQDINI